MAKREKEGDGAHTAVRAPEQRSPAQVAERPQAPAVRTEHPLRRLRDEMDLLFDRFFGRWPAAWEPTGFPERFWDVDVREADNEVVVRAEVPGFEPKDFDIHISGNTLTIQAEHKEEGEEKEQDYRQWHQRYGRFQRAIPLSTAVNADKVEARYHSGVLEVHLPRTEPSPKKRIEVKT
jgi:HSP20 family protein